MNNFQLIEDNNENNPQDNQNYENNELNLSEILSIFINIVPSSIYSIIIALILLIPQKDQTEEFYSQEYHIILYLKLILGIYLLYVAKGFFFYFVLKKNKINNNIYPKMILELSFLLLDISYFIFTMAGKDSFKKLSLDFMINNIYKCIFIYSLIFIGYVYLFLFFANIFSVSWIYIDSFKEFLKNENAFFANYNISGQILVPFLNRKKADLNHIGTCPICLVDVVLDDEIIILRCSDKHFFHSFCIIKWLSSSFCCPLCKSIDII